MMSMFQRRIVVFCLWAVLAAVGSPAHARPTLVLLAQSSAMSQDEAAATVRRQTGGRVLDVQTRSQNGGTVYHVKVLLPDGRVRVVTIGAR